MSYRQNRAEFIAAFVREFAPAIPLTECEKVARHLLALATQHMRCSLAQCNGPEQWERNLPGFTWDRWETDRAARELAIEARILKWAQTIGARVTFSGDPRGFTVHVHMPRTGAYNSWGGLESGYGVPTPTDC